jgi:hypothetical protein
MCTDVMPRCIPVSARGRDAAAEGPRALAGARRAAAPAVAAQVVAEPARTAWLGRRSCQPCSPSTLGAPSHDLAGLRGVRCQRPRLSRTPAHRRGGDLAGHREGEAAHAHGGRDRPTPVDPAGWLPTPHSSTVVTQLFFDDLLVPLLPTKSSKNICVTCAHRRPPAATEPLKSVVLQPGSMEGGPPLVGRPSYIRTSADALITLRYLQRTRV